MSSNVSLPFSLRDTWTSLQRAETLLFHAAEAQNPEQADQLFAGLQTPNSGLALLIRSGMGFEVQNLRPEDYFARYPFSDVDEIQAAYDRLAAGGYLQKQNDAYAFQPNSIHIFRTWMERVGAMMQSLDLGNISEAEGQKLLAYDHRIVTALEKAPRPYDRHVFCHHLRSLRPHFTPPQFWHHWMLVGTMLAASEDEEEYIRREVGLSPLVWFARRQVWFYHRRPWRFQVRTLADLVRRSNGYSPIKNAESACADALRELEMRGWLTTLDGEFRLTNTGLAATDTDEEMLDAGFLSGWPNFSEEEITELSTITTRLNERFTALI